VSNPLAGAYFGAGNGLTEFDLVRNDFWRSCLRVADDFGGKWETKSCAVTLGSLSRSFGSHVCALNGQVGLGNEGITR
jgi:hypothetical protein